MGRTRVSEDDYGVGLGIDDAQAQTIASEALRTNPHMNNL